MAKAKKPSRDLIELGMKIIAERGYDGFLLSDLAKDANLPLNEVYQLYPNRKRFLQAVSAKLDEAMFSHSLEGTQELSITEYFFEHLMQRFEAMSAYRPGFKRLADDARSRPALMLLAFCNIDRMAGRLLDAAQIRLRRIENRLARRAITTLYAKVLRTWINDDSEDLAATMAELDKSLNKLHKFAVVGCRVKRNLRLRTAAQADADLKAA